MKKVVLLFAFLLIASTAVSQKKNLVPRSTLSPITKTLSSKVPLFERMKRIESCDTLQYFSYDIYDDYHYQFMSVYCLPDPAPSSYLTLWSPTNYRLTKAPISYVFPPQSGNNGKVLSTNGSTTQWTTVNGAQFLSNITLTQSAPVVILGAGVRKVTVTGITGLLAGDRVLLTPTASTPAGYAIADAVATAAGTLEVSFTAPALAIGASFSIPCKVTVFR